MYLSISGAMKPGVPAKPFVQVDNMHRQIDAAPLWLLFVRLLLLSSASASAVSSWLLPLLPHEHVVGLRDRDTLFDSNAKFEQQKLCKMK